jgi:rRNA maturation endonuclease Nob1
MGYNEPPVKHVKRPESKCTGCNQVWAADEDGHCVVCGYEKPPKPIPPPVRYMSGEFDTMCK